MFFRSKTNILSIEKLYSFLFTFLFAFLKKHIVNDFINLCQIYIRISTTIQKVRLSPEREREREREM